MKPGSLWQYGLPTLTVGLTRRRRQFRHLRADVAVVLHGLAGVDAGLELQALAESRAQINQEAVVALVLVAEIVGQRDEIAGLPELPWTTL